MQRKIKVFVINLARSPERRKSMQKQLESFAGELDFFFFKAIDGQQDEHLAFAQHLCPNVTLAYKGRDLTTSEKACFASHYSLWQKCVALDEPILVLEDDVVFGDGFMEGIKDILNCKHEYVRFRCTFLTKFYPLSGPFRLSLGKAGGTQGYYLTPQGALKFLDRSKRWFCPVDDYMDMFFFNKVPIILYERFLLDFSEDQETTIGQRRRKTKLPLKLMREFMRIVRFCYRNFYVLLNRRKLLSL